MNTFSSFPRALCLLVLLSTTGCDQAVSHIVGPTGLRGATATMQDDKDDGAAGDDGAGDDAGDELGLPKIICCDCERTCTQPDDPDPMVGG